LAHFVNGVAAPHEGTERGGVEFLVRREFARRGTEGHEEI
jgi:hypothetical protein